MLFKTLPTIIFLGAVALATCVGAARAQSTPDFEQAPIHYSTATPVDAVARLQQRLASGDLAFAGSDQEVLRAVLRELRVPAESQVIVFSKTSLQRGRIRPRTPRALYFSDHAYVGWVPDGLIEVSAVDPKLGPIFYTFDPRATRGADRNFVRDSDCLRCHGGAFVRDIPGVFVRSVITNDAGEPLLRHGTELVDDKTPFERRWGGWYVTGYSGRKNHRGNAFASEAGDQLVFPLNDQRPQELSGFFDTAPYLEKTSDVVALLVLEHQLAMQNSLTRAGQRARKMLEYQRSLQKAFNDPPSDEPTYDSVKSVFASVVEDVVDTLLFRGAAPLPEGVVGHEAFKRTFVANAQRDESGHTLKDLQLSNRLFANRCSYLIYSESFTALPEQLKRRILQRLHAALVDEAPSGRYAYLDTAERKRIYSILRATHPDAKAAWTESSARAGDQ